MKININLIKAYIHCKRLKYNKENRMLYYASQGIIDFEDYVSYYDNKVLNDIDNHIPRID